MQTHVGYVHVASQWIRMSFDHAYSEGLSSPEAGLWQCSSFPCPGVPWAPRKGIGGDFSFRAECFMVTHSLGVGLCLFPPATVWYLWIFLDSFAFVCLSCPTPIWFLFCLIFCFVVLCYYFLEARSFLTRNKERVNLDGKGVEENFGGVQGEEIILRVLMWENNVFSIRGVHRVAKQTYYVKYLQI